jgi:hypothetical protein
LFDILHLCLDIFFKVLIFAGALTQGDRRAVGGSSIQNFAVEDKYGIRALGKLIDCLEKKVYPMEDPEFVADEDGGYKGQFENFATQALEALTNAGVDRKISPNQFLNR